MIITEYDRQVSLSGHLFDQFLINEALDIIEAAGGSFHLVNCHVGQSVDAISYSELEVSSHLFQIGMITYGQRYSDVSLPFEQYDSFMLYYN
jgi:hypothetical protein